MGSFRVIRASEDALKKDGSVATPLTRERDQGRDKSEMLTSELSFLLTIFC